MVDVDKLKESELEQLNKVQVTEEEFDLEELILLGDEKKIPIIIEYPRPDGSRVKARALVKQLTMKELRKININDDMVNGNILILQKALFKTDETPFKRVELEMLPIGVVNSIASKIFELSGVDFPREDMRNF